MDKLKYRASNWWNIFKSEALSPFTDRTGLLQFIAFPISIYLLWLDEGISAVLTEVSSTITFFEAIIWAVPFYLAFCAIRSIFSITKKENEIGQWVGNKFIYHNPHHIKTFLLTPEDDGKNIRFKANGLPPNSFAYLKTDCEQGLGWIEIKIHENQKCLFEQNPRANRTTTHGIRLNNKSETVIEVGIQKDSVPTIARISVLYWIVGKF